MRSHRGAAWEQGDDINKDLVGFGARLRALREARGLTQAELRGGPYSHAYISMVEAGRNQPPPTMLIYLADKLCI
jgi:transcriptional regulator with XRE-family HTH domain